MAYSSIFNCRQQVLPTSWYISTRQHSITSQKNVIFSHCCQNLQSCLHCTALNEWLTGNNEFQSIWKWLQLNFLYSPSICLQNQRKQWKHNSWCPRLDSNQSPQKIQVKGITIWINWLMSTIWAHLQACTIIILYIQLFHEMSAKF